MTGLLVVALLGLVVGLAVGLVGGGGSIIAVPALVYGAGMSPAEAIPTSLLVVGISSIAAVLPRLHTGIRWRIALVLGSTGIPAAFLGTQIGQRLNADALLLAFSALMVAAGIRMLMRTRQTDGPCSGTGRAWWTRCLPRALVIGGVVGTLTGMLGVGGGFLIIPALTLLLGIPIKEAVGTSLVVLVLNSAAGLGSHLASFAPDWPVIATFTAVAVVSSLLASRYAHHLKDRHVSVTFAIVIFLVAAGVATGSLLNLLHAA